jgi:hypothetical protein
MMGDETLLIVLAAEERPTPPGMFEHWREHPGCPSWGGFGYSRAKATAWFCFEHRADGERRLSAALSDPL